MGDFQESLFACFSNCPICLIVSCVPCGCCIVQAIAYNKATKEGIGMPLLCQCACWSIGCWCIGMAINRGKIRTSFNINGGTLDDMCIHWCCSPCAVCQEYREVKKRSEQHARLVP